MKQTALRWIERQLYRKNLALYDAYHRPNCQADEIRHLHETIDVLEYLIQILSEEATP